MADAAARQLALLAQQALENAALIQARDELRVECFDQAIENSLGADADLRRFKARTALEMLTDFESKLLAMVAAGRDA